MELGIGYLLAFLQRCIRPQGSLKTCSSGIIRDVWIQQWHVYAFFQITQLQSTSRSGYWLEFNLGTLPTVPDENWMAIHVCHQWPCVDQVGVQIMMVDVQSWVPLASLPGIPFLNVTWSVPIVAYQSRLSVRPLAGVCTHPCKCRQRQYFIPEDAATERVAK
jgi:hypothetical protein